MPPYPKGSNVIVKDYLYEGNFIFGTWDHEEEGMDFFILDDGDIYSEKELNEEYKCLRLHSDKIIEKFKEELK